MYVCSSHVASMDQPGKVANPSINSGQLNRESENVPVPVRAKEFDLARRVQPSRPAYTVADRRYTRNSSKTQKKRSMISSGECR